MATAYYYVTGPVGAWVLVPRVGVGPFLGPAEVVKDNPPPTFLGHTDKTPKPSFEPRWKPVFSSQSGEAVPADKLYLGTEVKVVLPLQRFDFDVVQALLAGPRHGRVSPPGTETYLDIGALLQRNGLGFCLWLRNEFFGTVNQAAYPDMPIGMFFPCCNVAGVYPDNLGRDTAVVQLLVEANWVQAAPAGPRVCFSQDPAWFKGVGLPG